LIRLRHFLMLVMSASCAFANTYIFEQTGTSAGFPVDIWMKFVTGTGTVDISIANMTTGEVTDPQNVGTILFDLKNAAGQALANVTPSFDAQTTTYDLRTVASTSPFAATDVSSTSSGWVVQQYTANVLIPAPGYEVCAVCTTGTVTPQATRTILGQPDAGTLNYSSANNSITKGTHSPFLYGTIASPVIYHLDISNVLSTTQLAYITLGFGTASTYTSTNEFQNFGLPEPDTILLMAGGGLLLYLFRNWRIKETP
jgi:hypothetical protein